MDWKFDPDTGIALDGTIGPTKRQHELAGESLKLQELIATMEADKSKAIAANNASEVNALGGLLRAAFRKLAEIQRQQREEEKRQNSALGFG